MSEVVIPASSMRAGDRIVIEPAHSPNFEAVVAYPRGWGLVHGVLDWQMARDNGDEFIYSIHFSTPVTVVNRKVST
jgi:hypothetical protein